MIKILLVSPISWDSTSFYRSSGVFHNLNKLMNNTLQVDHFQGRQFTWAQLGGYDIVFFQRPARADDLKLAQYCKDLGIKVWVDYDDNLFTLPYESRAYFEYDNKVRKTMLDMLLIADAVSVSTEELKTFFTQMKVENVEVIPNAVNDDWIKPVTAFNKESNVIVWRGSETHWFDVECFSKEIHEAMQTSEDKWHFMGWPPASLLYSDQNPKIVTHKGEDVIIYNGNLKLLKPKLMHVPLVDNALNRAKSNIAWIEATCAGAVTIGPNWPEWNRPGVICYDTPNDYMNLLKTPSTDYEKCWNESMNFIKENLMLSKVNEQRKRIVNKLR